MKMIITPEYIKNFSCIADKCEDHCCHSWDISIDKSTYQFMTQKSELKNKAAKVILRTKGESPYYAKIELDNNGVCPFRENNGLCEVHKVHGHKRLSNTCQSYPRISTIRGHKKEHNLSLSCPEAARQILLNPAAMEFHQENYPDDIFKANNYSRPVWYNTVQQFIVDILFINNSSLEQRLSYIGMTLRLIAPYTNQPDELQKRLLLCCEEINNNNFNQLYDNQQTSSDIQAGLLIKIFNFRIDLESKRNLIIAYERFDSIHKQLIESLSLANGDSDKQKKILQYGFNNNYTNYFKENTHVWINYIIYVFYQNDFPAKDMQKIYSDLIVDFFIIRGVLSAISSMRELNDDDVILVFQTYHRIRSHNKDFMKNINEICNEIKANNTILPLLLIKNS